MSSILVRPAVRRGLLGQQQVRHGELPAEDDEQLGRGVQCLVPAANEQRGESHSQSMIEHVAKTDRVYRSSTALSGNLTAVPPKRSVAFASARREVRTLCSLPTG